MKTLYEQIREDRDGIIKKYCKNTKDVWVFKLICSLYERQ